jgi:ankyrin repeat protein
LIEDLEEDDISPKQLNQLFLHACYSASPDAILHFLRMGANVKSTSKHSGWNCFHWASASPYAGSELQHFKVLLRAHPQGIFEQALHGETPLHIAVKHENVAMCARFLELYSLNHLMTNDENNATCFDYAAFYGHFDIFLLLKQQFDQFSTDTFVDQFGLSIFIKLLSHNFVDFTKPIFDINQRDKSGVGFTSPFAERGLFT